MDTPKTKAGSPALSPREARLLWVATLFNVALAVPYLPLWLSAMVGGAVLWRAWLLWRRAAPPRRGVLLMVLLATGGLMSGLHPSALRLEGLAMLVPMLAAVKQLETGTRRDAFVTVLLLFFVVLTCFLFSQTLPVALLALIGIGLSMAVLANLHSEGESALRSLKLVGVLALQSLPFAVVLFVLFPRNLTPMWSLPMAPSRAETGLGETMTPGSISQLSLSGETAFRVRFSGRVPPKHQLYWRGPVMTHFDGRSWSSPSVLPAPMPARDRDTAPIEYDITLEPHNKHWLLGLDLAVSLPPFAYFTQQHQLASRMPVQTRIRYTVASMLFVHAEPDALNAGLGGRAALLQLPESGNPRARQLAASWRRSHADDEQLVKQALQYFKHRGLSYTLRPAPLGEHPIDDFLFETREGFCEHFASSFVFLMRAAGVPARVVTGYQGGELNPIDDYLVVRQADAHAWAEVWLAGKGWERVDPTALAVPLRVNADLAAALPSGEPLPLVLRQDIGWMRDTRHRLDALTNRWNQWVLGYNMQSQQRLLSRFGLHAADWRKLALACAVLVAVFILLLAAWAARPARLKNRVDRAWQRLSSKLARHGLAPHPWEGALDHARRVGAARAELRNDMYAIATLYAQLRYGRREGYGPPGTPNGHNDNVMIARLETLIRKLKL
jgi:transglutaminase-like putative cysteine protease